MPTPHKHAAVIKAFADGQKIQFKRHPDHQWSDISVDKSGISPAFRNEYEYRVKPNVVKYRIGLYNKEHEGTCVCAAQTTELEKIWESHPSFIRWVTEWIEVDV